PVNDAFASIGIPFSFDVEHVTVVNAGTKILLQVLVSRIVKSFKPLPTMVGGITIGVLGFVFLAFASTPWIFILGIAVFSIGEMTAHPKYYSYIGLVAPQDKKAVYMGYAFLYGVIGSLIGSNLGGVMYESILKPLVGQPDVSDEIRNFWFTFAAMGVVAMAGLLLYNRFFAIDTPATRRKARAIMSGVYSLLLFAGCWFLYTSIFTGDTVVYKTMVQALIMLLIGAGGLSISLRRGVG
ncbi:MAG: MFS transporter, partial [Bacteroidota bacterium]